MKIFYFILFFYYFMIGYAKNLSKDQDILLQFRLSLFDPNILVNNWTTDTFVCNWVGVSCEIKHSRVKALDLHNMNLIGTIPPCLANLSFLVSLNLSGNHFQAHLPKELGQLNLLKFIDLSSNFIGGEIPSWFGRLDLLLHLNLSYNNFTGTIPSSVGNISNLENLDLGTNLIHGSIPYEITDLLNLRILRLVENQLSGSIPLAIYNMSSLRWISLLNNNLSGSLPEDMCGHLPKLEALILSSNDFSGNIPIRIGECYNLQYIKLYSNRFNGIIPRSIGNLTRLDLLNLGCNNLEGKIPRSIGNLTRLFELYLGKNSLEGKIPCEIGNLINLEMFSASDMHLIGLIPPSIFNISSLKWIYLHSNNLSGKLPDMNFLSNLEELLLWENHLGGKIPNSMGNATKLRDLELGSNSFSGLIPKTIGNLRSLDFLQLGSNNLTTETSSDEWSFLFSLANCQNLTFLDLSFNPLDDLLPSSISNLSQSLQYLYLDGCKLRGSLPIEISSLNNIIQLSFRSNKLSGPFPSTLGRLKNLQDLDLSFNRLQGSLPLDVCGLNRLNKLTLKDNELDGVLPTCLGDLASLRYLYLSSNKLHSTIPSTLWSLKYILEVDLSSNVLSGSLPIDIGNLKVLIHLNLSRNLLSAHIPLSVGSLPDLQVLDLSSNNLEGPIPPSMGDNMKSLVRLDLSNNKFSGAIPKSLENLNYLNYINLSYNKLEGEIPSGGPFVNLTAEFVMNNSALCGAPRFQVPPCSREQSKKSTILHVLTILLPPVATVITILGITIVCKIKKQQTSIRSPNLEAGVELVSLRTWRRLSYNQLSDATNGFSELNLLGMGSFGSVYKGVLSDGTVVAIKVFNLQTDGAFKSFDTECEVMRQFLHRNLVKVITSVSNLHFRALVLEFIPNGSLERWLYSENCLLDVVQRINIMIDVGSALVYLHLGHPSPVIHCDIKPSNVLLDEDMVAHLGDFGIAKLLGEEEVTRQTMTLATVGYMAPEYGVAGIISVQSDIYSYGIMLMEIFTTKKPTDEIFTAEMNMKHWVRSSISNNDILSIVDSNLLQIDDQYFVVKANCIASILELALKCCSELPEYRVDIENVVPELNKIKRNFLS